MFIKKIKIIFVKKISKPKKVICSLFRIDTPKQKIISNFIIQVNVIFVSYKIGSACPSFRPSLQVYCRNWIISSVLEIEMERGKTGSLLKKFGPKMRKNKKMDHIRLFKIIEKFDQFYNENWYDLLCFCSNYLFGENLIPKI